MDQPTFVLPHQFGFKVENMVDVFDAENTLCQKEIVSLLQAYVVGE